MNDAFSSHSESCRLAIPPAFGGFPQFLVSLLVLVCQWYWYDLLVLCRVIGISLTRTHDRTRPVKICTKLFSVVHSDAFEFVCVIPRDMTIGCGLLSFI